MLTKRIDYNIQQEVKNISQKKYKPGFFGDDGKEQKQKEQTSKITNALIFLFIVGITIFAFLVLRLLEII